MADTGKTILVLGVVGVGAYLLYEWWAGQQAAATTTPATGTPGTSPTLPQPTTVSTAPPSTTTTPAPSGTMNTLVANMQSQLNGKTTATADQWDWAFSNIMGQPIDAKYGINFDSVYGPAVNGVRNNGATMSGLMFLQLAASAKGGTLPGLTGFGKIARYAGPAMNTVGNMIYQAHHPFPYQPTFSLRGIGAYTQASGWERALWAGRGFR